MDQSYLSKFRESLLGAQSAPTSVSDINIGGGNEAQIGNLQNMYKGTFGAGLASAALGAAGGASQAQANQEEADAKMRLQEEQDKLAAAEQAAKDATDPTKYRKIDKDDGGYDFYDPTGKQIDIKQFAAGTGQHITDVLKKSQNPADQEFVKNYTNVQDLVDVMQRGNKKDLDKLFKKDPSIKSDYELLKKNLGRDPDDRDVVKAFRSGYGKFFDTQNQVQLPQSQVQQQQKPTSILDRIKSFF